MNKIKIYLADLSHNYRPITARFVPYSVGLIASYAKKMFGNSVEIKIFKWPDKLAEALKNERCDILGVATYAWNNGLAHWACKIGKKYNPNLLTVLGGPHLPILYDQKLEYFKENKDVDIRVLQEGELAFANIIKTVLEKGIGNRDEIFSAEIGGCVYLNKEKDKLVESFINRIAALDSIPSPYTTGILDEFLDGTLGVLIQTNRGCPFTCNFCLESDKYFNKITKYDKQTVLDELEYIGKKMYESKSVIDLMITDSNFGMYKGDKKISEKIVELNKKYNWPIGILMSTGKHVGNVLENTVMLLDFSYLTLSVQSMNPDVLEAIGRKNLPPSKYKELAAKLRVIGKECLVETIVPLPKETLQSFLKGIKELMDIKVARIVPNTLLLLMGTEYKDKSFINKWGYESRYRLLPGQAGIYDGEKVFEIDEVGVATNTFSLKDYFEVRKFGLILEMIYNSKVFREIEFFIEDFSLSFFDFTHLIYKKIDNSNESVKKVFNDFRLQSETELKKDPETLVKYYGEKDNWNKIFTGEEGANLKYKAKALLLSEYQEDWLSYVFDCLKEYLLKNNVTIDDSYENIVNFTKHKLDGVFDSSRTDLQIMNSFNYDLIDWINQKDRIKSLKEFKNKTKIKFVYNVDQTRERNILFNKYTHIDKNIFSKVNFIESIRPQHRLYRKCLKV